MAKSLIPLLALTLFACAASPPPEVRVWSSSSSSDGFASCPDNTSVVGGGFEVADSALGPGKAIQVTASRPHANGWRVDCVDERGVLTAGCKAWVVCATVLR